MMGYGWVPNPKKEETKPENRKCQLCTWWKFCGASKEASYSGECASPDTYFTKTAFDFTCDQFKSEG